MPEDDSRTALHAALNCYLSTIQTAANTVAQACPPIGKPYGQRLGRLRARLAFDSSTAKIEESCAAARREMNEYAERAFGYIEQQRIELRRGIFGLEGIIRTLAQRQEFYGDRLRRFAGQMEKAAEPAAQEGLADVIGLQVAGLLSCVESMSHESQSLLQKMRDELARVEVRLADLEITDPVTGLT